MLMSRKSALPLGAVASGLDKAEAAQSGFMTSSASARIRNECGCQATFPVARSGHVLHIEE